MCKQIKFSTGVLLATRDVATTLSKFSIYDITKSMRELVNKSEIAFTDKSPEDVNGVNTYRVEHSEVKDIFTDLFKSGALNLKKKSNGNFNEYCLDMSQAVTPPPSLKSAQKDATDLVVQTSMATVRGTKISSNKQTNDFTAKLIKYITGRGVNAIVSMKQVQSRFDDLNHTCAEYAAMIQRLGYTVDISSPHTSKWTVTV